MRRRVRGMMWRSALAVAAAVSVLAVLPVQAAPRVMPGGEIFDPEYYAEQNPDVTAALGTDTLALYRHYTDYGRSEGRLPYDPAASLEALLTPQPVSFAGKSFLSTDTEADFTGVSLRGLDVDAFLEQMPYLQKAYLLNCGLSSQDCAALQDRHPEVKLVFSFVLAQRTVRTDAVAYSSYVADWKTSPHVSDAQTWYLRYCTDMIALDLGHNYIRDLSFLEYMPELKVLILVDNGGLSDFSKLHYCTKLKYLEIFVNRCNDISFLDDMPEIEDLNISFNPIYSTEHLHGLTHLRRLWIVNSRISAEDSLELMAEYPDTIIINSGATSVGSGWRSDAHYYAMRELFRYNAPNETYH